MSALKRRFGWVLSMLGVIALAGCATMSESDCLHADWYLVGLEDGRQGRPAEYFQRRQSACFEHNVGVDAETWARGHAEGLDAYCTPRRGWREGRDGNDYRYACPQDQEEAFLAAFDAGSNWRHASQALASIRTEVAEMEEYLVDGAESADERRQLIRRIREAQDEIGALEATLYDIERRAMRRGWMSR